MRESYLPAVFVVMILTGCSRDSTSNSDSRAGSDTAVQTEVAERLENEGPPGHVANRDAASKPQQDPKAASLTQDEQYRELVLGTWEDDYQGHRTMTLNEDGTGTMIVELSGMKATLFAARLEFNMQWSLADGRLKKRTIDGKPERRVKMILSMMGDRVDEPILELTDDRLLLLDKDGETKYDWRRKK